MGGTIGRKINERPKNSDSGKERKEKCMSRWKHSKFAEVTVLVMAALFLCWFWGFRYGIFGSKVDWISQHSVVPDYFRQQFYQTGALFPEFAANLGGGQNIYNFSYYGLYSPAILISYLLPFVKMGDYLMAASVISLAASAVIFYQWLTKRGFRRGICFLTALLFLMAGPMVFHSYNQVMFVNYMPFLCMAFWGVDRYFEKNKPGMYAVSVFFMIMTSFYFSIGGILALVVYGLYRCLNIQEKENRMTLRQLLLAGIRFLMPMLTGVLMSGILLIPTAVTLTARNGGKAGIDTAELLIPRLDILGLVYSPYGIGLTTMVITVLLTGLWSRKWSGRILSAVCILIFTVPVFAYLLNGGLYIRNKVMIPFLPLLCYLIADYLEKQAKREIPIWKGILPYFVTLAIVCLRGSQTLNSDYFRLLLAESGVMLLCSSIFYRFFDTRKRGYLCLILPSLLFLLMFGTVFHRSDNWTVDRDFYAQVTDGRIGRAIETILEEENGFYRTEQTGNEEENAANLNRIWSMGQYVSSIYSSSFHQDYQNFRKDIFETEEPFRNILMQSVSENPVFRRLMGVKYLISEEDVQGYEPYQTVDGVNIYRCQNVLPIAYATDSIMSQREHEKLKFPYNQLALLSYAVTEGDGEGAAEGVSAQSAGTRLGDGVQQFEFEIPELKDGENTIEKTQSGYHICLKENKKIKIRLPGDGDTLFLRFGIKNNHPSRDVSVRLESEKNKLTSKNHYYYNENTIFTYAIALEAGQREARMSFGKGDYDIEDPVCFSCNIEEVSDRERLCRAEFYADKKRTSGNRIAGNIEVPGDGYFITSIPYDAGFEVFVDGKSIACEKVNTAFLGFQIEKGNHEVELIYHAKGVFLGKILTLIGILMLLKLCVKKKFIFGLLHRGCSRI